MLNEAYPTSYQDDLGRVSTIIYNDGTQLRMNLRGVDFLGTMLDDFEPCLPQDAPDLQTFTFFDKKYLCGFTLEWDMPLSVVLNNERLHGTLHVHFELGHPLQNGRFDRGGRQLTLHTADSTFRSKGDGIGDFGDELADIYRQLPENMYPEICFFCAFSDYFPGVQGEFGTLCCFRKAKKGYLMIDPRQRTHQLLAFLGKNLHEQIQETYHCTEFEHRTTSDGRIYGQL